MAKRFSGYKQKFNGTRPDDTQDFDGVDLKDPIAPRVKVDTSLDRAMWEAEKFNEKLADGRLKLEKRKAWIVLRNNAQAYLLERMGKNVISQQKVPYDHDAYVISLDLLCTEIKNAFNEIEGKPTDDLPI